MFRPLDLAGMDHLKFPRYSEVTPCLTLLLFTKRASAKTPSLLMSFLLSDILEGNRENSLPFPRNVPIREAALLSDELRKKPTK